MLLDLYLVNERGSEEARRLGGRLDLLAALAVWGLRKGRGRGVRREGGEREKRGGV